MKKIIPAFVGENRHCILVCNDYDVTKTCRRCGQEIKVAMNKFKLPVAVEWTKSMGWVIHTRNCRDFDITEDVERQDMNYDPDQDVDFLDYENL
jgi:hypothetical protein